LAGRQKILALEQHLALNHGGASEQSYNGKAGHRFAGAGLADEAKGVPPLQREGHAVDGEGFGVALPKEDLKIPDVEERGLNHDNYPARRNEGSNKSSTRDDVPRKGSS